MYSAILLENYLKENNEAMDKTVIITKVASLIAYSLNVAEEEINQTDDRKALKKFTEALEKYKSIAKHDKNYNEISTVLNKLNVNELVDIIKLDLDNVVARNKYIDCEKVTQYFNEKNYKNINIYKKINAISKDENLSGMVVNIIGRSLLRRCNEEKYSEKFERKFYDEEINPKPLLIVSVITVLGLILLAIGFSNILSESILDNLSPAMFIKKLKIILSKFSENPIMVSLTIIGAILFAYGTVKMSIEIFKMVIIVIRKWLKKRKEIKEIPVL